MDAETEGSKRTTGDVADDGLDKLLRKAVTVSQAKLPIATIDEDIDDIAVSYLKENERPDNILDDDFLRLIERTRQRRELLNQKMGKTPDPAPRKRRTPLSEDLSDNLGDNVDQQQADDSPKRQCVRGEEQEMKADTPAIASVKSRLQSLSSQRSHWADSDATEEKSSPVPTPRKSLSSPPLERASRPAPDLQENAQPAGSQRKSRFAMLASSINNWEDDLSHPTVVKEEEKKPRWQPPKAATTAATTDVTSTKTTRAPPPPSTASSTATSKTSPTKKPTSATVTKEPAYKSPAKEASANAPVRTGSKVAYNSSPKPFQPYNKQAVSRVASVKSPCARKDAESQEDAQVTMRRPAAASAPPSSTPKSERPISARLANWEQKISETNQPDVASTPKSGLSASSAVAYTPKQSCTPARPVTAPKAALHAPPPKADKPAGTPVVQREVDVVQMRPKVRKSVDDEPTAHPVLARMSAWEQMTVANVVSDIKKVRPGDCTPVKTPGAAATKKSPTKTPAAAATAATKKSPVKGPSWATPNRSSAVTPKKSFTDSIKDRAQQVNPSSAQASSTSPGGKSLSPKKASSAMKAAQEKLVQQTQSTDMAERLRQERMAELQSIQGRWKNGILREGTDDESEEPPKPPTSGKKHGARDNARAEEDEDMETGTLPIKEDEDIEKAITGDPMAIELSENAGGCDASKTVLLSVSKTVQDKNIVGISSFKSPAALQHDENRDNAKGEGGCNNQATARDLEQTSEKAEIISEMDVDKSEDNQDGKNNQDGIAPGQTRVTGAPAEVSVSNAEVAEDIGNTVHSQELTSVHQELPKIAHFDNKLASLGLDGKQGKATPSTGNTMAPPAPPPLPTASSSSSGKVTGKPPRPNTLFGIVSQKKNEAAASSPAPQSTAPSTSTKVCRKVKFDDSFDSDESDASLPKKQAMPQRRPPANDVTESDTTEDPPTEATTDDSDFEVVLRRPRAPKVDEDDDLSLSAFVPASVRRQSVLPQHKSGEGDAQDTSFGSLDSFDGGPGAPPDFHKSTVDLVALGYRHAAAESSSSSLESTGSEQEHRSATRPSGSGYSPDATEESVDDRDAIGDLLDEAMDSEEEEPSTSERSPAVVMRKRPSHRRAIEDGSMPFSINEYRASRNMHVLEVKQTIVRNSQYAGMNVQEEEVEMPSRAPTPAPRRSVQERVKELQELVQQEQNIIMQTSNALNQCCSSSSYFAGSTQQVECNRILLISCQKRQAYMMEIQRLRDTKMIDEVGAGPRGSLTISDIRLPLKKEFVTKIGTSHDTSTYYFILLLRNGQQVICTQMLSTHDPMMRGSLDFPNLIKINGITGSFRLSLDIYSMSVSREHVGKDKKKKTPKKMKGSALTVQSPGGPMAVRTTSFSQVTSLQLSMRSLDKHSFNLERLSHLSPLHGTIHMNLKCLMEANVEERGFLTMFEDVSGFGSWHRRWCALSGNKLQFWKYPDDEIRKDPMGYIDLKRCVTEKVGLISRDVCARPNTFELATVRQPRKGEKDTLTSRTYNTMTTIRHMLSADTKEERIMWSNKMNRALANIRTWHSDAMRPIPK